MVRGLMLSDRLKSPIEKMIRAMLPLIDYQAWYRARVVSQSSDKKKVDLKPDDPRIPGVKAELMLGLPGAEVQVTPGAFVLLGWKDGNPQFPVAKLWEGGASVINLTLKATQVVLGDTGGEPAAKATTLMTWLGTHTHTGVTPGPGATGVPAVPPPAAIAATNVQVK
jgi:hypothetical protein